MDSSAVPLKVSNKAGGTAIENDIADVSLQQLLPQW